MYYRSKKELIFSIAFCYFSRIINLKFRPIDTNGIKNGLHGCKIDILFADKH